MKFCKACNGLRVIADGSKYGWNISEIRHLPCPECSSDREESSLHCILHPRPETPTT